LFDEIANLRAAGLLGDIVEKRIVLARSPLLERYEPFHEVHRGPGHAPQLRCRLRSLLLDEAGFDELGRPHDWQVGLPVVRRETRLQASAVECIERQVEFPRLDGNAERSMVNSRGKLREGSNLAPDFWINRECKHGLSFELVRPSAIGSLAAHG